MSTVISVENVSKAYRLGAIGGATLKEDFSRWWAKVRGKPDPLAKIGSEHHGRRTGEQFWALQDINFDVKQGEVLGIVGNNGAGKSTLLKILSQVTAPTSGKIKIRGRIASLLEVGTGFHPELTGRENIFLNGAILGMTKPEIRRKLDEIIDFSGVEEFVDTPVKRYSSGMYVRLAFAVAAHLEPEILIVDEVLAVGDVEFQKKCVGKMKEVSRNDGRTVIFVSHNMAAVKSLTSRAILLAKGEIMHDGLPDEVLALYLESSPSHDQSAELVGKGMYTRLVSAKLTNDAGTPIKNYTPGQPVFVDVVVETDGTKGLSLEFLVVDAHLNKIALSSLYQFHGLTLPTEAGTYLYRLKLKPMLLASGSYTIDIATSLVNNSWDHYVERALTLDVPVSCPTGTGWDFKFMHGFGAFAWLTEGAPHVERLKSGNNMPLAAASSR